MKPQHAAVISLILALSVAAGAFAAERTAATASKATAKSTKLPRALVRRARALDRLELSLRKALRQRPPALPKIPHFKPVHVAAAPSSPTLIASAPVAAPPPTAVPQRVITVRPPPHIITIHRHGGDHEGDGHEGGGGDD